MQGGTFTRSNSREVASKARLDRFLFSADWEDKFPTVSQRRMSRLCSDHFPFVLEGGSFQRGSMPFRFENIWLKDEGFVDRVRSWRDSYRVHGAPSFILANKLKLLKNDLKRWNVDVFGHVEVWIKKLWKDLSVLENMEESWGLSAEERVELGRICDELEKATLLEEISWRQKFRVLCIREGDRNTKIFHRMAISHRRLNSVDRLMVDGVLSSDPAAIANCISQFYRQLYFEDVTHRPVLDDVDFTSFSVDDASWLDRPFEEEVVLGVINDFNDDKAPSPDGFPWHSFSFVGVF